MSMSQSYAHPQKFWEWLATRHGGKPGPNRTHSWWLRFVKLHCKDQFSAKDYTNKKSVNVTFWSTLFLEYYTAWDVKNELQKFRNFFAKKTFCSGVTILPTQTMHDLLILDMDNRMLSYLQASIKTLMILPKKFSLLIGAITPFLYSWLGPPLHGESSMFLDLTARLRTRCAGTWRKSGITPHQTGHGEIGWEKNTFQKKSCFSIKRILNKQTYQIMIHVCRHIYLYKLYVYT